MVIAQGRWDLFFSNNKNTTHFEFLDESDVCVTRVIIVWKLIFECWMFYYYSNTNECLQNILT